MNVDELIFSPIDIDGYKEKMWWLYLDLLPPEIDVGRLLLGMDDVEMNIIKQHLFDTLSKSGNPHISNSQELKVYVDAKPI